MAHEALEAAQAALDHLVRRNAERKIDDITFDRLQPEYVEKRDQALARLQAAEDALHAPGPDGFPLASIEAFCDQSAARLDELERPENFAEQQALVQTVVRRIELRAGRPVKWYGRLGAPATGEVLSQTYS